MGILKRPPGDEFTFRLFFKLKSKIKQPADSIYLWSAMLDPNYQFGWWDADGSWNEENELVYRAHLLDAIKQDVVIIGIKDHLTSKNFNPWVKHTPTIVEYLSDMFDYYSNKKFILITSVENLESYISNNNVSIVCWGGDLTNQQAEYKELSPIIDKNFDSKHTFLSLNRNNRAQRLILLSMLHGMNIQEHGLISCMFREELTDPFVDTGWQFNNKQLDVRELVRSGFFKLMNSTELLSDKKDIYGFRTNDNVNNFNYKLRAYYTDTFVEIITETSYTETAYLLTEKTLNSIYGCNFPILLCGCGSVALLREIGFDMFDDIIDHSYDTIKDPINRLYTAITSNLDLLTNNEKTKDLWKTNKHRFLQNVEVAKTTMYEFYSKRALDKIDKLNYELNLQN
jgi:hypothetical protein